MNILEFKHISKTFSGIKVLDDINLAIKKGEVHAICGENGAGKSTLMKILSGVYTPDEDEGELLIEEENIKTFSPIYARNKGVSIIYQELDLVPYLTVVQNIVLANEPKTKSGLFIDEKKAIKITEELFKTIDINVPLNKPVKSLSIAMQQMVMIAKALSYNAKILIMDEPTATLTDEDVERLFELVNNLKQKGISILYISHRLEEIFQIADRFTVLRDGKLIVTKDIEGVQKKDLIKYMIGRELLEDKREVSQPDKSIKVLEVKDLSNEVLDNISFELYKGEILGISGLVGAGRTELARAIFGADPIHTGEIRIDGKKVKKPKTVNAIKNSIGLLPEDRKAQGLFMNLNIRENSTMANLRYKFSKRGIIKKQKEYQDVEKIINRLNIKPNNQNVMVKNMSGGNQQKVVLAKWLLTDSKILIIDEPTRGIDVGAKEEIYNMMYDLKKLGVSIIMISSELPEILRMSDRVVVMADGKITGVIARDETHELNEINIMKLAHAEIF